MGAPESMNLHDANGDLRLVVSYQATPGTQVTAQNLGPLAESWLNNGGNPGQDLFGPIRILNVVRLMASFDEDPEPVCDEPGGIFGPEDIIRSYGVRDVCPSAYDIDCPICMIDVRSEGQPIRGVSCPHYYHEPCFISTYSWFRKCALCKARFQKKGAVTPAKVAEIEKQLQRWRREAEEEKKPMMSFITRLSQEIARRPWRAPWLAPNVMRRIGNNALRRGIYPAGPGPEELKAVGDAARSGSLDSWEPLESEILAVARGTAHPDCPGLVGYSKKVWHLGSTLR